MKVDLSDTDVVFIYGHFQKQLAKIIEIENSPNCPFDKDTITTQKAPYISVIEKLKSQFPVLNQMNN